MLLFHIKSKKDNVNNELSYSDVDTGCFQHWYIDFGHTNLGMPKFNL